MFAQIERIEPPFWYAGMKNPEVQIMFYGKNIAKYQVSTSDAIPIVNVKRTENPNYIFVTINSNFNWMLIMSVKQTYLSLCLIHH